MLYGLKIQSHLRKLKGCKTKVFVFEEIDRTIFTLFGVFSDFVILTHFQVLSTVLKVSDLHYFCRTHKFLNESKLIFEQAP